METDAGGKIRGPANPHGICSLQPEAACAACEIGPHLNCRHSWADLATFAAFFLPFAVTAAGGLLRAGYGWVLAAWGAYALFFFNVWESRALCSHCPFYAREGRVLHCLANEGMLKPWRFRPGPMSRTEGIQFLVGAAVLVVLPFPFLVAGSQYLLAAVATAAAVAWCVGLRRFICTKCVNFSCPLNRVPKELVDAYLAKNPVMRAAWEAAAPDRSAPSRR